MKNNRINLFDARQLAEKEARRMLGDKGIPVENNILDSNFIEEAEFWIFFRNKSSLYPPTMNLNASAAYLVSRSGNLRTVADFWGKRTQMDSMIALFKQAFADGRLC